MNKKPKPPLPKPDRTVFTRLEDSLADRVGLPRGTMVNFVMRFNVYNRLLDIKEGRAKRGHPSDAQIKEVRNVGPY
jgi:hypothetical protein